MHDSHPGRIHISHTGLKTNFRYHLSYSGDLVW